MAAQRQFLYQGEKMNEQLKRWCNYVDQLRPIMNRRVESLQTWGAIATPEQRNLVATLPYRAQFSFPDITATTTIHFELLDHHCGNEDIVTITNTVTLPRETRRQQCASAAVYSLLQWAERNKFAAVYATQVSNEASEQFWRYNGFIKREAPNPHNDFARQLPLRK